ncbi:DedA family protein [Guyparkeria halophila]|uniref:DedA family protein n=1 Tax=Guyparkeria halophila TaxID=47960 RepID=A0A6I6D075_9GAMM|nr:YqaA family protein [Guyparkeria halophila]QGT79100.1 DedA family protein [Guyparkeria halophila]
MRLFGPLYDRVLAWSAHRRGPALLGALSFAESSFFPIPPDVMLMPMALARPRCWWGFALIATLGSVLGGVLGYLIGFWAIEAIEPWLADSHYAEGFDRARDWFAEWGFWAVLVAGFSPIPYKVFTIAAGALTMNPLGFVVASFVGRGSRFFLVSGLVAWAGPRIAPTLRRYIEWLGWLFVAVLLVAIGIWQLM